MSEKEMPDDVREEFGLLAKQIFQLHGEFRIYEQIFAQENVPFLNERSDLLRQPSHDLSCVDLHEPGSLDRCGRRSDARRILKISAHIARLRSSRPKRQNWGL